MLKDSYLEIFSDVQKVLVVMPHPDDCELYCGGLVARLIKDGKTVRVIKMTSGEKGSRQEKVTEEELQNIREAEDKESMKVLGVSPENNIYLNLGDGKIMVDTTTIGILVKQIRLFKPDLILTTNPENIIIRFDKDTQWFNHRDHLHTGQIVSNASYPFSRDILFYPEHFTDPDASSHICNKFLFVDFYNHEDNVFIDVTDTIPVRVKAHACHKSQYSPEAAQSSADFFTGGWDSAGKRNFEIFRYVIVD